MTPYPIAAEAAPEVPLLSIDALRNPEERRRLSAPAVRLFGRLADRWDLSVDDRRGILGGISRQTWYNWRGGEVGVLTSDQLERISLALGVHKGLQLVFADDAAQVRWLKAANTDAPFNSAAPLDLMRDGGVMGLYDVRRYLDAWRGVR